MSEDNELYTLALEGQLVASRERADEYEILYNASVYVLDEIARYIKARKQVATRVVSDGVDELSAIEELMTPHD